MPKRDMDQPEGGRNRDVNEPTDESTFGRGDEEIRGVADEDDEFEDSEDLDEEEEDEEV